MSNPRSQKSQKNSEGYLGRTKWQNGKAHSSTALKFDYVGSSPDMIGTAGQQGGYPQHPEVSSQHLGRRMSGEVWGRCRSGCLQDVGVSWQRTEMGYSSLVSWLGLYQQLIHRE